MYKNKFDKMVENGIISQDEKEKTYNQMQPNIDGQFTGISDMKINYNIVRKAHSFRCGMDST